MFWEDTLRYLYLPRLKEREVLAQAIQKGSVSQDFFGTAYGQHEGKYDGFQLGGGGVQLDDTLLLIEPEAAKQYEANLSVPSGTENVDATATEATATPPVRPAREARKRV